MPSCSRGGDAGGGRRPPSSSRLLSSLEQATLHQMGEPDENPGDPYAPTPAVVTDAPGPASVDSGSSPIPKAPSDYPNLWNVKGFRAVVPTAFRLWRTSLVSMLVIGFTFGLVSELLFFIGRAVFPGDIDPGDDWDLAKVYLFGAFPILWQQVVTLPALVLCKGLFFTIAANRAAFGRRPEIGIAFGFVWPRYWRLLGVGAISYAVVIICTLLGIAANAIISMAPSWSAYFAFLESEGARGIAERVAEWLPVLPIAFFAVRWELASNVALFERALPMRALKRSVALARQRWLPVAAIIGLMYAIEEVPRLVLGRVMPVNDDLLMASTRILWTTLSYGFCAVMMFTLYAALRDREIEREGKEGRASPAPTPP